MASHVTPIEDFTTTAYAPWWRQYHITSPEEISAAVKGGEGGQMNWALAVSPTHPKKLLFGTDTSGIWRSDDGGAAWAISTAGLKPYGTVDIAYDPDNANIAYVAACLHAIPSTVNSNVGVYKTTDGGYTWGQICRADFHRIFTNKIIQFGTVNSQGYRTLYVGTHGSGLLKSEDAGATWTNLGWQGDEILDLYVDGSTLIVASNQNGVLVSTDRGSTWTARNSGLPSVNVTSIAVNPNDTQMWFTVLDTQTVYKSADAGANWISTGGPADVTGTFRKLLFGAYNPDGAPVLYLTLNMNAYQLRYSDDLGATWHSAAVDTSLPLRKNDTGFWAECTTVHPTDPYTVWTALDGSVFKSTGSGSVSLKQTSSGISGYRVFKILYDAAGNITYMAILDHGIVKAAEGFAGDYIPFVNLENVVRYQGQVSCHSIVEDPSNRHRLFAKVGDWGSDLILEQSTDGGRTWSILEGTGGDYGNLLEYHPQNNQVIYAGKLRSTDNGFTWMILPKTVMAISPINGDIVYAQEGSTIFKSIDQGDSWTALKTTIHEQQRITVDRVTPDRLWVGTFADGMYRLDGETAIHIDESNGLVRSMNGTLAIFHIAQDPNHPQHYVAAGCDNVMLGPSPGLFESNDGGLTWSLVRHTPGMCDIWSVSFHVSKPFVYLCTSNGLLVYDWTKNERFSG